MSDLRGYLKGIIAKNEKGYIGLQQKISDFDRYLSYFICCVCKEKIAKERSIHTNSESTNIHLARIVKKSI